MHTYMCTYECDDNDDNDEERCILHTCTLTSRVLLRLGRFLLRPFCARPMAHVKKETDAEVEVGLHTVDAGLFLANLKKEERIGTTSGELPKKEEWEVDDPPPSPTATALDSPNSEVEVGLHTLDAALRGRLVLSGDEETVGDGR